MSTSIPESELVSLFYGAANRIADRIQGLVDASTITADERAALSAELGKLRALGRDPANPVPPEPPSLTNAA